MLFIFSLVVFLFIIFSTPVNRLFSALVVNVDETLQRFRIKTYYSFAIHNTADHVLPTIKYTISSAGV